MQKEDLPKNVVNFLDSFIDSVELLRVLLLLHSQPERVWTTAQITAELRSIDSSIAKRLADLYSRKILTQDPSLNGDHRFNPSNPGLLEVIRELSRQNEIRQYRVIELIYSKPSKVLKDLADAFKIREDKS